jgi:hypothetical protein
VYVDDSVGHPRLMLDAQKGLEILDAIKTEAKCDPERRSASKPTARVAPVSAPQVPPL